MALFLLPMTQFEVRDFTIWPPEKCTTVLTKSMIHRLWFPDYQWQQSELDRKKMIAACLLAPDARAFEVYKSDELVGILLLSDIKIPLDAQCHMLFWDKSLVDKRELVRDMMRWAFTNIPVSTLRVEIPTYARQLLGFVRKALRFRYEGESPRPAGLTEDQAKIACRKYRATLFNGVWHDHLLLSVTADEFAAEDKLTNASSGSSSRGHSRRVDSGRPPLQDRSGAADTDHDPADRPAIHTT